MSATVEYKGAVIATVDNTTKTLNTSGTWVEDDFTITDVSASGDWTKIAENTYSISTTQTSAQTHATLATGHSEIWTSSKWVYVRIRDTAGHRNGYFYGSDQFFYNINPANGTSGTSVTTAMRIYERYNNDVFSVTAATGTTGYGVWADTVYSDGRVRIRKRYNSSNSLTVDGTYKVEVYILEPADGVAPFVQ